MEEKPKINYPCRGYKLMALARRRKKVGLPEEIVILNSDTEDSYGYCKCLAIKSRSPYFKRGEVRTLYKGTLNYYYLLQDNIPDEEKTYYIIQYFQ